MDHQGHPNYRIKINLALEQARAMTTFWIWFVPS